MRISDWSSDVCSADLDTLDQAVLVVGVLCTFRVLDAAFLDLAQKCRRFFCATAEAESDDANLCLRIFSEPVLGLLAELIVRRFHPSFEGIAADTIDVACDRIVLAEDRQSTRLNSSA